MSRVSQKAEKREKQARASPPEVLFFREKRVKNTRCMRGRGSATSSRNVGRPQAHVQKPCPSTRPFFDGRPWPSNGGPQLVD